METLLISLYPRHANNILSGRKIYELRKNPPRFQRGLNSLAFGKILIYATMPIGAIVGICDPFSVTEQNASMWCNYSDQLCLSHEEIKNYLGDRMGYGIRIRKPKKITPIPLSKMREVGILPPQGYRYLTEADLEKLGVKFNG